MSDVLAQIQTLVGCGEFRISEHGYDELAADDILASEALDGVFDAILVESYPHRARGSSVLTLQRDPAGRPLHVVWGISTGQPGPAVLITAYRPDPSLWDSEFKRRKGHEQKNT